MLGQSNVCAMHAVLLACRFWGSSDTKISIKKEFLAILCGIATKNSNNDYELESLVS